MYFLFLDTLLNCSNADHWDIASSNDSFHPLGLVAVIDREENVI